MIESPPSAQELKDEIDDLRDQWNVLEGKIGREKLRRMLEEQIFSFTKKLKELYGEEY